MRKTAAAAADVFDRRLADVSGFEGERYVGLWLN
jgi:hypothetical protein